MGCLRNNSANIYDRKYNRRGVVTFMKKHKNKFIAALVVVAVLSAAWFFGAMPQINVPEAGSPPVIAATEPNEQPGGSGGAQEAASAGQSGQPEQSESGVSTAAPANAAQRAGNPLGAAEMGISGAEPAYADEAGEYAADVGESYGEPDEPGETAPDTDEEYGAAAGAYYVDYAEGEEDDAGDEEFVFVDPTLDQLPAFVEPPRPEGLYTPQVDADELQIFAADHPNMRAPVEPQNMDVGDESFTVTLSVRAHMILYNMHLLHRDQHELVPEDGWIFPPTLVTVWEGESVHNVLQREMRRAGIHMSSRWTPIFNSAYVEAINNLFEFDVGALSGWMYRVNGWFPNFGASRYLLAPGDIVEWIYTVDLGRDLGVQWLAGDMTGSDW